MASSATGSGKSSCGSVAAGAGASDWAALCSGLFSVVVFAAVAWYITGIGRRESEDEYISGMRLTDKPAEVNKLLHKNGELSDLRVGDLHMVRMAEANGGMAKR